MPITGTLTYQYLAGLCVNIITISYGGFCAWPSASLLILQSDSSPLDTGPMTANDVGNVSAMLCVGGALGTLIFSWCIDRIGRKKSLVLLALPSLIGWLIIPFARNPLHFCISRFFGGLGGAGTFFVVPIYLTELAEDRIRGILGTFLVLAGNFGVLLAFVLGYYFSYSTVAWILSGVVLVYLIPLTFLPESPQFFMNKNKPEKAERALRYFRMADQLHMEMEKLKGSQQSDEVKTAPTWQIFTSRVNRKALLIGIMLGWLVQFCGQFAMMNYTATIFKQAGSNVSPNLSAIIVGLIQLLGSYVATFLVDKAGRRTLLIWSAIGASLGHACLGIYTYLNVLGLDTQDFRWVSLASFSFILFITCCGAVPLPVVVIAEIMPREIRSLGTMICIMFVWGFAFISLKILPIMSSSLGLHGIVFFYGGCCFLGALFVLLFLPETKGKSIDEISRML